MSLRIIGGTFKNRPLKSPPGVLTKPTTSLMRKAVFDICQEASQEANFLDLFACSGAMGIEAISRGARFATFIEKDRKTVKTLQENLKAFDIEDQAEVICADVFTAVLRLSAKNISYNLIYIDPPYPLARDPKSPLPGLLDFLDKSTLLAPNCTLFLEEGAPGCFSFEKHSFSKLKHKSTRRFGESMLHQLIV